MNRKKMPPLSPDGMGNGVDLEVAQAGPITPETQWLHSEGYGERGEGPELPLIIRRIGRQPTEDVRTPSTRAGYDPVAPRSSELGVVPPDGRTGPG